MSRATVALSFALLLCTASSARALDPLRAPSQYVFQKWGAGTDLPSHTVHALLQTRDHYLWLGTSNGLVRFDGARFQVWNGRNTPGFGDGVVTTLAEGPDGSLYFGLTSAIMRYHQGAFSEIPIPTGTGVSCSLLAARDGSVWIGLLGRPLFRWTNGRLLSQYKKIDTTGPRAIVEGEGGTLWIGTRLEGLFRSNGETFAHVGATTDTIQALRFDHAGALWIGTPHGLLRLKDGHADRYGKAQGLTHESITALLEDRDGNLWIGTAGGGLNRFRGGVFSHFTSRHGLTDDDVHALLEDHEGNLWIGTAQGLDRLSDGRFITYGRPEGLRDPSVTAAIESADGSVWLGTASGEIARLRAGAVQHYHLPGGLGKDTVLSLRETRDGSLWMGLDNGRVFRLKDEVVREQTPSGAPRTWKISTIAEDEAGPVFFATGVGLARLRDRRTMPMDERPPRLGFAYQILQARDGVTWICASLGLARVSGGLYKVYTAADGLPHERVRSAVEDDDGSLWLATIGGLAHLEGGRIRAVTTRQGLYEDQLRLVLDDGRGYLWLASVGGISRVSKQELRALLAGSIERVHPLAFDGSDGLRTTEVALSSNPGFRARDGRLWFATPMGLSVVDPARVTVGDPAPGVTIETVAVDDHLGRQAEYPPGRGEVTIEYASLGLRSAPKQLFRYRLDGLDHDWNVAGTRRTAYYSNLPPGRYRFSVMASNHDGLWNGTPAILDFAIRPPFYRTPVFYAGCLAGVVGVLALAHRLRVRRMEARFSAILHERTRIARELHDTLAQGLAGVGMQMDTALKILPDDPTLSRVRRQIDRGRAVIRMSLAEVRRSIWVLRAQTARDARDLASSLSQNIAHLTAECGIGTTFDVTGRPRPLSSELEHNLLRLAHEAVINAVRHSGAKTIRVGLHYGAAHLDLRVCDDGHGFDPGATLEKGVTHFGLAGLTERTRALGGEMRLESQPGAGTEVECRLPYRNRTDTTDVHDVGEARA